MATRCKVVKLLLLASAVLILIGCPSSTTQGGGGEVGGGDPADPASNQGGVTFEQLEEIKRIEGIGHRGVTACYTEELERRDSKKLVAITLRLLLPYLSGFRHPR